MEKNTYKSDLQKKGKCGIGLSGRIKMWVATVDFMKAFDLKRHQFLWKSLEHCGIETHYICFLKRLFAEQEGSVSTDKDSDMF